MTEAATLSGRAVGDGRDLRALFSPSSVAVVGASDTPGKWGHRMATSALAGAERRSVWLVNSSRAEVLGQLAYHSLLDLPAAPEAVVLTVPAAHFETAVDQALTAGARALIGITAGVGEVCDLPALAARVRAAGAVLLGPNCAGMASPHDEFVLALGGLPAGGVAIVSQSGAMGLDLTAQVTAAGLGISRFLTVGDQADLTVAEVVLALADDDLTSVIACYVEDFRDGRAFVDAVRHARASGKLVAVVTVGGSDASARAAASHTGALVSDLAVVKAACEAAGAQLATTAADLAAIAMGTQARRPRGRPVCVIGDGGGHVALAADLLSSRGLDVPMFGGLTRAVVAAVVPQAAACDNPVDLGGAVDTDPLCYLKAGQAALDSGDVDAVVYVGGFGVLDTPEEQLVELATAEKLADLADRYPVFVQTFALSNDPATPAIARLRERGVPLLRDLDRLAVAVDAAASPPPAASAQPSSPGIPVTDSDYWAARTLMEGSGIPMSRAVRCQSASEAVAAGDALGYPVVLKAVGPLHKTDVGGVRIGLPGPAALQAAATDMLTRLAPCELSVEEQAAVKDGVEMLVGARQDSRFGPVLAIGLGGVDAEAVNDVATLLAPATHEQILNAVSRLRAAALLGPHRGRAALDLDALAASACAVSRVAAEHAEIAELEVNPLLLTPTGALALDARVLLGTTTEHEGAS